MDKISGLRGVEFEWRSEEYSNKNLDERRNLGLIAQEVENILPEAVYTDQGGYKSLDYASIVPLLIEAVKELKTQNEDLQLRIKALERDKIRQQAGFQQDPNSGQYTVIGGLTTSFFNNLFASQQGFVEEELGRTTSRANIQVDFDQAVQSVYDKRVRNACYGGDENDN